MPTLIEYSRSSRKRKYIAKNVHNKKAEQVSVALPQRPSKIVSQQRRAQDCL